MYWNDRYDANGTSGAGSIGECRKWKWDIISRYINDGDSIIDVGCGDQTFWDHDKAIKPSKYIGIDLSSVIIEKNKEKFKDREYFAQGGEVRLERHADSVLCLDMLFHIMDDDVFTAILDNLFYYAKDYVFINTWANSPFKDGACTDSKYQYYRLLDEYIADKNLVYKELYKDNLNMLYVIKV